MSTEFAVLAQRFASTIGGAPAVRVLRQLVERKAITEEQAAALLDDAMHHNYGASELGDPPLDGGLGG